METFAPTTPTWPEQEECAHTHISDEKNFLGFKLYKVCRNCGAHE